MIDDTSLQTVFEKSGLPGGVALITDARGVTYSRAFGQSDALEGAPMAQDTIFQIASMTKPLVTVAAMQLVEQEKLSLDAPIGGVLPALADPQVITGFELDGRPNTRAAMRPITLRHLLTHTSGLGYIFVQPEVLKHFQHAGMPAPGSMASVTMPLLFDPGDKWEYGVSTDWVGLAIEAVTGMRLQDYLSANVLEPLGMTQTAFRDALPGGAAKVHARQADGSLAILPLFIGGGEFDSGGGGLTSTAADYARFMRMMLNGGELDSNRILSAESVMAMSTNQIGDLRAGAMGTSMPDVAQPFDQFPDQHTGWTLGFLTNPEAIEGRRSAHSLSWAGIFNSYFWIDPAGGVGGLFMTQLSPFGDPGALACFEAVERMAYPQSAADNPP
ncbi:serine hydrolase domain-containing protein [Altererythrobacter aquiaggeris]|uniref:serine hydrolase domain-containing protein n=1 Tax=Aestuarierythrobacter aquiaggeris TaxID=1898396 RepID=UPI003017E6F7